jgi:hypothetical protein
VGLPDLAVPGRQQWDRLIAKVLPPTSDVEPESRIVIWDIVLDRG